MKIKKVCPYCDEKLERYGKEYKCINDLCPRVNTGKITNFLTKLKVENFSDKTVETLYEHNVLRGIHDIFNISYNSLIGIPGFEDRSIKNLITEIEDLKIRDITQSQLLGSLGIPDIGEKKTKKILEKISLKKLLKSDKEDIYYELISCKGIGTETANTFLDFVKHNKSLIKFLLDKLNITIDTDYMYNVVFTGFTNKDYEKRFNELGCEVSDNVNSKTIAVISASNTSTSGKIKSAIKKGISIVPLYDIEKVFEKIKKI